METRGRATREIPEAEEAVLSTLNRDGSRRWLHPRLSHGRFLRARRIVGYGLIALFTVSPYLRIGGKPPILLDVAAREFTFFGTTFEPTDTLLLALLFLCVFVSIFLLTALLGRVWCGWGCPQTVYMELVYRPIERLFEGRRGGPRTGPPSLPRRAAKYAVFLVVSMFLAHTFLAYFVGVERLAVWVRRSPFEHPMAFVIMAATTGLMLLDFCYFREQVCTVMCPYGRFQSVLLDRRSLVISYDAGRGEPRGRRSRTPRAIADDSGGNGHAPAPALGHCVDCHLCVVTCPTGIDIRSGLQMECVGCAQCIDACDAVMDKVGFPRGLIRYTSQEAVETGRRRILRPRVVIYAAALTVLVALFGTALASRSPVLVTFLRGRATPYRVLEDGSVASQILVKLTNRTDEARTYGIEVPEAIELSTADLPAEVAGGDSVTAALRIVLERRAFDRGRADVTVTVIDDTGSARAYTHRVLGPLYGGAEGGEVR